MMGRSKEVVALNDWQAYEMRSPLKVYHISIANGSLLERKDAQLVQHYNIDPRT
jgi:hypothetical protein